MAAVANRKEKNETISSKPTLTKAESFRGLFTASSDILIEMSDKKPKGIMILYFRSKVFGA